MRISRPLMLTVALALTCQLVAVCLSMAKETDGDVPLTGISASFQPDLFTGALTGSIPIDVPPGRNDMQPDLMLSYASSGGNGWVGMGWKLEMGTIERQTRWGVLYQPTTAEEQAGKVYTIRLNGVSADLVQDATDPLLYHEKIKGSFLRIKKLSADGTAGWEITDTKGAKYRFGTGATTRIQGTVGGLGTQIFKWCLERVEDRNGNYMTMTYTPDQGQGYLSQIDYAGNGATAPINQVKFYLEDRTDKPTLYKSHFPIATAKRLKAVEVKANGSLVRAYKLTYAGFSTKRSDLVTIQQFDRNAAITVTGDITGSGLPPVKLSYTLAANQFTDYGTRLSNLYCPGNPRVGVDFNGDGRQDFWCGNLPYISGNDFDFSLWPLTWFQTADSPGLADAGDFTGDGKTDLLINRLDSETGTVTNSYLAPSAGASLSPTSMWTPWPTDVWQIVGDFTGDGKRDVFYPYGAFNVIVAGGTTSSWIVSTWCSHPNIQTGDFNGDGKTDLFCHVANGTISIALSTGTSFIPTSGGLTNWCPGGIVGSGDINGDDLSDLWCHLNTGINKVAQSSGSALLDSGVWLSNWCAGGQVGAGDFSGDGKLDLWCLDATSGTVNTVRAEGTGFVTPSGTLTAWCPGGTISAVDFNGDTRSDLVCGIPVSGTFNKNFKFAAAGSGGLSGRPDIIYAVENGIGGETRIGYVPTVSPSSGPHVQMPYPTYTVSVIIVCDNMAPGLCLGNSSSTTYSYIGGYQHIGERDFRGFKTAVVTSPGASDADKIVTTTWFHQGNELTPIDTENPGLANGYMKGRPYRTEVKRKSDNLLYTKTETTYHDDRIGANTTAPWFTPPSQVDTIVCDGGPCKTTRVAIAATDYDAYGNVLRESHHGDTSVTGDEKTVQRTFLANTTDYVVNAPARETIYKGLSVASADKLAETLFYYDGTGTGACTAAPTGSNTAAATKGKLTKVERWLSGGTNPISGMEYDATTGVLLCSRDPLGNKTTMTYDPTKTFVLSTTNQLGHVTTSVYSGVNGVAIDPATGFYGTVKNVTDPNGKVVNHEYDALGRKTKTTAPDGLVTQVTYPTLAEYGVIGTQKISTSTSGANLPAALTSSTFFDGLGRPLKKESSGPNGTTLVTETQYDVKEQVLRTSLPYFKTTESVTNRWRTMTYDALGRVTQVTHPDTLSGTQLTSKSCYAPFVTVTLDPSGARKRETKDAYGRVVKIEEYSTTTSTCDTAVGTPYATTNYTYDLLGNLTKVVDALGNRTTMRYDTLSRKLAMSDPDMSNNGTVTCGDLTTLTPAGTYPWYAAPCWNYQYDAAGNLTRQTDAKTQHLWFRYDGLNRRTQKDYTTQKAAGSGDVRYVYDDTVNTFNRKGRLRQMIDAATNVTFEYDARGRTSKSSRVLDGTTYVTTSVYDGVDRLKEVTYPGATPKTVEYLYTGPVLDKVQDKVGSGTTIYATYSNYTSQGQAQTITYGNGVVTTSTFADPAHPTCVPANSFKLCTLKTQKGTNPLYQDFAYTFTADGNVDLITDPINGNQDFGYDALDRLTSATGPYGTGGATATFSYTYNQIGNMLSNPQVGTFTYPTSGAGVVRPHAVTAAGSNTYSYDNNGNLTSGAGRIYTWNLENKPTCIAQAAGTCSAAANKTTFVYDGDGGRVKKIVGTTTTRYISRLYECDTTGATTSCSRFIWADQTRIATIAVTSGTIHYWHGDHLGSSSVITDSTGAKVQALTYYPYGATRTNVPGTPVNVPYKYTGKELDSTGLYYYEARYYDPMLGRFISPDTIVSRPGDPQDLNRYAYARNNPLLYTDPTGHFFKNIFKHFFRNVGRLLSEPIKIAKEIGHKPLNLLSPTFWLEASYRVHPALLPLRASGVLRDELDAGQRAINKFRNSNTGRYLDAGVITTAAIVGAVFCGGCTSPLLTATLQGALQAAYIGAAVGSASGLAQAAYTGGDPFQAAALGGLIGAAGGAIGGGITGQVGFLLPSFETVAGKAIAGTISNLAGSVIGSSVSGGLSATASGTHVGKGFGFGALSGAIGAGIAMNLDQTFTHMLGAANTFGLSDAPRRFANGGVDWTGGWVTEETK